jgi:hypothetical protein
LKGSGFIKRIFILVFIAFLLSGCGGIDIAKYMSKDEKENSVIKMDYNNELAGFDAIELNGFLKSFFADYFNVKTDNQKADTALLKYFYSDSLEVYKNDLSLIIHLPREISLNNCMIDRYIPDDEMKINTGFLMKKASEHIFRVSVDLKAAYSEADETAEKMQDEIKVRMYYEVSIISTDKGFQIVYIREDSGQDLKKQSSSPYANSFAKRLPYLSITLVDENSVLNEDDINTYKKEKALILEFMESCKAIDSTYRTHFIDTYKNDREASGKMLASVINKNKTLIHETFLMSPENFILKEGIEYIEGYKNIKIMPHYLYSKNNKIYAVSYDLLAKDSKMTAGKSTVYKNNAIIVLDMDGNKIMSFKIKEFRREAN